MKSTPATTSSHKILISLLLVSLAVTQHISWRSFDLMALPFESFSERHLNKLVFALIINLCNTTLSTTSFINRHGPSFLQVSVMRKAILLRTWFLFILWTRCLVYWDSFLFVGISSDIYYGDTVLLEIQLLNPARRLIFKIIAVIHSVRIKASFYKMTNNNPNRLTCKLYFYIFDFQLNIYCEFCGLNTVSIPLHILSYLFSLMTVFRAFVKSSDVISRTFKVTPAPRVSMRFALSIWSPNKGSITMGTPLHIPSYMPWEPECVIKARVFGWPGKQTGRGASG